MTSPALSPASANDQATESTLDGSPPPSPVPWILGWAVYSLLALGYFGYQSAWLSGMCLSR